MLNRCLFRVLQAIRSVTRTVSRHVGIDELGLWVGTALLATGAGRVWPPAVYLVPGAVLLWVHLPVRRAFIDRPQTPARLPRGAR